MHPRGCLERLRVFKDLGGFFCVDFLVTPSSLKSYIEGRSSPRRLEIRSASSSKCCPGHSSDLTKAHAKGRIMSYMT